ncbi:hypothetical protein [Burkholderia sp. BCC1047]|nr:hypothetical protein [Burkholderia sp. BCC1047]
MPFNRIAIIGSFELTMLASAVAAADGGARIDGSTALALSFALP